MKRWMTLGGAVIALVLMSATWARGTEPQVGGPSFKPSDDQPIGWRGDRSGAFPGATPVRNWSDGTVVRVRYEYEHRGRKREGWGWKLADRRQRNILWKTPMPSYANSQPLIIGDRVYTLYEPDGMACVDLTTGKILWQKRTDVTTLLPLESDKQKALREYVDICHTVYALCKNHVGNYTRLPGLDSEKERAAWKERYGKVRDLLKHLVDNNPYGGNAKQALAKAEAWLKKIDTLKVPTSAGTLKKAVDIKSLYMDGTHWIPRQFHFMPVAHWTGYAGWSFPSPITDGKHIYITFGQGQTVCFDLDGNRKWVKFVPLEEIGGDRIPQSSSGIKALPSPMLAGDILIGQTSQQLVGYDKTNGEVLWKQPAVHAQGYRVGTHIVVTLKDGRQVIAATGGHIVDVKTGKILGNTGASVCGSESGGNSLVAKGDVVYYNTGGNNGGPLKAIRLLPDGANVKTQIVWEVEANNGSATGVIHDGWYYRMGGRDGEVFRLKDGAKRDTGVRLGWVSPIIAGDQLVYYEAADRGDPRPTDDFIIQAASYHVEPETARLRDLGPNFLVDSIRPNMPHFEKWAPKLHARGWTISSCGGEPAQYGYAPMVAKGDKLIVRSCSSLVCIGPRLKGIHSDDKQLGKKLADSTDVDLIRKYLFDDNAYYRRQAISSVAVNTQLAAALKDDLKKVSQADNYPELRGLAIDAIMQAEPESKLLHKLVTDFNERDLNYDYNLKQHRQETFIYLPMRAKLLLLGYVSPETLQRGALQNLSEVFWDIARAEPAKFAAAFGPIIHQFDDHSRGAYINMLRSCGSKATSAVPGLKSLAASGNNRLDALHALQAIDADAIDDVGPRIARDVSAEFKRRSTDKKEQHRLLHFLRSDLAVLKLLGKHQKGALPGMQAFVDSDVPKEDDRQYIAGIIKQVKAGTYR